MPFIKKIFFAVLLSAAGIISFAQQTDTIINTGVFKSYFNFELKQPLYVTYTLFMGGGGCDRDEESFHFKKCGVRTASDNDYSGSHLDKGHLANAEDFAFDCDKEEKTFCYYNCVPQTIKLNRGIWKTWEEKVRVLSQTTKLFVIAGAIYGGKTIGPGNIGVPDYCYKIVLNSKTRKIIYCMLFPNDDSKTAQKISLTKLKKKLGYALVP